MPKAAADPKPTPATKQPSVSKDEMQALCLKVRRKKLQWHPDEDGHFQVVQFNEANSIIQD